MPIYDYRCNSCKKRVSLFFRSFSVVGDAICPSCGGTDMKRIVTTAAVIHSTETRVDHVEDALRVGEFDLRDKRKLAAWSKRFGDELGGEAKERIRQEVEKMEAGEVVNELVDPKWFARYVTEEQKRQVAGEPNALDGNKPQVEIPDR